MGSSYAQKASFLLGFDSRISFISGQRADFTGIRAGIEYDRFRYGAGVYSMTSSYLKRIVSPEADTTITQLEFTYLCLFSEFEILEDEKWEVTTPLVFGFGKAGYKHDPTTTEGNVYLLEGSVTAQYKFRPWIGIGAGVGYRQLISNQSAVDERLSNVVYTLKSRIFLFQLLKGIFSP